MIYGHSVIILTRLMDTHMNKEIKLQTIFTGSKFLSSKNGDFNQPCIPKIEVHKETLAPYDTDQHMDMMDMPAKVFST